MTDELFAKGVAIRDEVRDPGGARRGLRNAGQVLDDLEAAE
jgi:hypothetical protein